MMIPQNPGTPGTPTNIKDNVVGLMSNGVLLDTHEQTWSYDSCNGHSDKAHQYHYHIPPICYLSAMGVPTPESANWWMADDGSEVRAFGEMADQWPSTGSSPVIGFARDGFPIYGLYDSENNIQRSQMYGGDLDECNGKEDGSGNYGYYITAEPPFVPTCLRGSIGSFAYAPTDIMCPKKGITTSVGILAEAEEEEAEKDSGTYANVEAEEEEAEKDSGAYANVPVFSALVVIAAFFV